MKYKLLVLDVDGTLLNDKKEITPRTHAALLKAQQMGVHVVLASGRPTNGVQPLAEALELNHYGGFILSYNGGQIINAQTGELMFEKRIDPAMIPYLNRKAKENGFAIFTYHKDYILTDSPENKHVQEEAELNKMRIIGVENFPEAVDFAPCKCILTSDDENNLVGLAIGDGVADVSMLQLAGTGVAMGNARDSVKACADFTTLSNNMDGVAVAIEKAILATIKPTEVPLDQLNARAKHALMGNLGIQYTYASEDRVEATMPVDERTRQPFGILHGGATLALAETVAGLGSMILAKPDEMVVGMQVSGSHMSSAHEGDTVRAVGTIIHKGRSSHVWNVDIFTSTDKLVSSVRVINSILKKK